MFSEGPIIISHLGWGGGVGVGGECIWLRHNKIYLIPP